MFVHAKARGLSPRTGGQTTVPASSPAQCEIFGGIKK